MLASLLALTRSQELRFKKNEKRDKDVAKLKCGGGDKYNLLMTYDMKEKRLKGLE